MLKHKVKRTFLKPPPKLLRRLSCRPWYNSSSDEGSGTSNRYVRKCAEDERNAEVVGSKNRKEIMTDEERMKFR